MKILNYHSRRVLTGLLLSCLTTTIYAGDEEMNPTAYHRFDPETGFMVPIQQPHEGQQQNHSQSMQDTEDVVQSPDTSMPSQVIDEPAASNSFWLYLLAGITLLAGLAAWIRSKKARTTPGKLD